MFVEYAHVAGEPVWIDPNRSPQKIIVQGSGMVETIIKDKQRIGQRAVVGDRKL